MIGASAASLVTTGRDAIGVAIGGVLAGALVGVGGWWVGRMWDRGGADTPAQSREGRASRAANLTIWTVLVLGIGGAVAAAMGFPSALPTAVAIVVVLALLTFTVARRSGQSFASTVRRALRPGQHNEQ